MGICYCRDCQRLTGGTAWAFMVVQSDFLHINGRVQEFSRPGASGNQVHMEFCDQCGSTVFGRPEAWPHIRTISASSLNDISQFLPSVQVWIKDAPKWMPLLADIAKFETNPSS